VGGMFNSAREGKGDLIEIEREEYGVKRAGYQSNARASQQSKDPIER